MTPSDGDTRPGFRHRRSSRPPADVIDLPEPVIDVSQQPIKTLHQYVAELHHDMRSLRSEFMHRQESAREAIYSLGAKVERLTAMVAGLRTAQDHALKLMRASQSRWSRFNAFIGIAILAALLLRMYGVIGV